MLALTDRNGANVDIMTADEVLDKLDELFGAPGGGTLLPLTVALNNAISALTVIANDTKTATQALVNDANPAPVYGVGRNFKACAVSAVTTLAQTGVGEAGDDLSHIHVVPTSTTIGAISIKDGAGAAIEVFNGATLSTKQPFLLVCGGKSLAGAWSVTFGAGATGVAYGNF